MIVDELWQELTRELITLVATFRSRLDTLPVTSKPDQTLLTDADLSAQDLIIRKIRQFDGDGRIIAEEDSPIDTRQSETANTWIVDPIDGTAQFVKPDAVEFCSVVALFRHGRPVAALIVAPELGPARTPITICASLDEKHVTVNQHRMRAGPRNLSGYASTTRSRNSPPSQIESRLVSRQYKVKTRTTSQTLDMARTAFDLSSFSPHARPFDLFHRREQKLWDGAAGLCLAVTAGLEPTDESGKVLLPLSPHLLGSTPPIITSSVVGQPELLREVLGVQDD